MNSRSDGPQVTVLMGVYNARRYVEVAIRSILDQTFSDFEFLIVDDASTDGSDDLIRTIATQDTRVRFVRLDTNVGLGEVLNRGVREARGQYIARMDADDISVRDRLEVQLDYFARHPEIDVVGSYAIDVAEDGRVLRQRRVPLTHDRIVNLIWTCPIIHPTVMFRREAILRAGSYKPEHRRRQDYDLWFRCAHAGLRFANIPLPLVRYTHSVNTFRRNDLKATWTQVKIGLNGCKLVGAGAYAYIGTVAPLFEAMLPKNLRFKFADLKARIDPRQRDDVRDEVDTVQKRLK